jgi:NAD(P)-dependent dehydrogenase (short-subunit alcohol dehydrogenase family)
MCRPSGILNTLSYKMASSFLNELFKVHGKRVLVTGASSQGIGRRFALTLHRCGASVAIAGRREDKLRELMNEMKLGGKVISVPLDVSSSESVSNAIATVCRDLGGIDILVNAAGIAMDEKALDTKEGDWDAVINTNLKGTWLMNQAAAAAMRQNGGSIINVASILGLRTSKRLPAYAASKAAVVHMTKCLALEWAPYKIRVNCICPGYFVTDMNRSFLTSKAGERFIARIPMERCGRVDDHHSDLDGPLLLLCSEAGAYMTGSAIVVDGGHVCSSL